MFELLLINARGSRILLPREYIEVNLSVEEANIDLHLHVVAST